MDIQALLQAFTNVNRKELILVTVIGLSFGFVLAKLKLPAMSPIALTSVVGIFALWAGYTLGK